MRVVAAGDTAHAVIHDHCPVVLELVDLSDEERSNGAEAVVAAIVRQEVDRPFRLDSEPPVRFKLLRLRDRDHRLLVTFHHLVFDALSQSVFLRELASAYAAFTSGGLPETHCPFNTLISRPGKTTRTESGNWSLAGDSGINGWKTRHNSIGPGPPGSMIRRTGVSHGTTSRLPQTSPPI
jgi:hypothetical protein